MRVGLGIGLLGGAAMGGSSPLKCGLGTQLAATSGKPPQPQAACTHSPLRPGPSSVDSVDVQVTLMCSTPGCATLAATICVSLSITLHLHPDDGSQVCRLFRYALLRTSTSVTHRMYAHSDLRGGREDGNEQVEQRACLRCVLHARRQGNASMVVLLQAAGMLPTAAAADHACPCPEGGGF